MESLVSVSVKGTSGDRTSPACAESRGVWLPAPRFLRCCQQHDPGRGPPRGPGHLRQPPPAESRVRAGCHRGSQLVEQPAYDSRSSSNSRAAPSEAIGEQHVGVATGSRPPPPPQHGERGRPEHSPRGTDGWSIWPKMIILEP